MTKSKGNSRKTGRVVRMPATKFAHLRKRLKRRPTPTKLKTSHL